MFVEDGSLYSVKDDDIDLLKNNPQIFWEGVNYVSPGAFENCLTLKQIIIPEGIRWLGYESFKGCKNLKSVCFKGNSLVTIGDNAFENCLQLTEINLPGGLEILNENVFLNCKNLKTITIPKSVKKINKGLFRGCEKLERVTFKDKNNFPEGFKRCFRSFNFTSFVVNGDEVTFVRNIEKNLDNENE